MNDLQKTVVVWILIIGVICYLFGINPVTVIGSVVHAGQTMHQTNAK